jgi:hypothetical protein
MLLGRQQDAVSRSANLAAESAGAYLEGLTCSSFRPGRRDRPRLRVGVVLAICWGSPFLILAGTIAARREHADTAMPLQYSI